MNEPNHITNLIVSFLDKTITKEEHIELTNWLSEDLNHVKIFEKYLNQYHLSKAIGVYDKIDENKAWKTINELLKNKEIKKKTKIYTIKNVFRKRIYKYAGILLLTLGLVYFLQTFFNTQAQKPVEGFSDLVTLQVDKNEIFYIDLSENKQLKSKTGNIIGEVKNKRLSFINTNQTAFNTNKLKIPNGQLFYLELNDSTLVTLNAGSEITFPAKFNNQVRKVDLNGEAYFDVTKKSHQTFVVKTNHYDINVLGTEFNISSYSDMDFTQTVLVEGSVKLSNIGYEQTASSFLKPNELAEWDSENKKLTVKKTDVSNYIAWMDGKLIFKDLPFKIIRKKLEKKYNIQIQNNNVILDENTFTATFDIETIYEIMETLKRSYPINYEINKNKIIIK